MNGVVLHHVFVSCCGSYWGGGEMQGVCNLFWWRGWGIWGTWGTWWKNSHKVKSHQVMTISSQDIRLLPLSFYYLPAPLPGPS